jgi:hypothetical protein
MNTYLRSFEKEFKHYDSLSLSLRLASYGHDDTLPCSPYVHLAIGHVARPGPAQANPSTHAVTILQRGGHYIGRMGVVDC